MVLVLEKTQYHWVSGGGKILQAPVKLYNTTSNYTLNYITSQSYLLLEHDLNSHTQTIPSSLPITNTAKFFKGKLKIYM